MPDAPTRSADRHSRPPRDLHADGSPGRRPRRLEHRPTPRSLTDPAYRGSSNATQNLVRRLAVRGGQDTAERPHRDRRRPGPTAGARAYASRIVGKCSGGACRSLSAAPPATSRGSSGRQPERPAPRRFATTRCTVRASSQAVKLVVSHAPSRPRDRAPRPPGDSGPSGSVRMLRPRPRRPGASPSRPRARSIGSSCSSSRRRQNRVGPTDPGSPALNAQRPARGRGRWASGRSRIRTWDLFLIREAL